MFQVVDSWHVKNYRRGEMSRETYNQLQADFLHVFHSSGMLETAAILERINHNDLSTDLFFTPDVHVLAVKYGANPCEKPMRTANIGFLTPHNADAWQVIFPGENGFYDLPKE